MNSDFLLVAGDGWVHVTDGPALIDNTFGYQTVYNAIVDRAFSTIVPVFDDTNWIPPGHTLLDARIVNTTDPLNPYNLWILTGPPAP